MKEGPEKIKISKSKNSNINRIVIIGGGFAGVRAALDILKKSKEVYITLIDKNSYHSYHPDYYEVATAVLEEFKKASIYQFINLQSTLAIPFEAIFKKYLSPSFAGKRGANLQILQDTVSELDFDKSLVKTAHKKEIPYNWLIVAAGSETNFHNIPRLQELAYELKTVNDAINIRNGIDELFEKKGKREKINIIIGGGGFTGSELAGEIIGYVKNLAKIHNHPSKNISVKLIEASSSLLGGASRWARKKAEKRLKNLGVEILLNNPIEKVSKADASQHAAGYVYLKNDEALKFDALIWTAGVEAAGISKIFSKKNLRKKLCLNANKYLLVPPFKNVFAVGDIAYCVDQTHKSALPMTAQTAISQGAYAASAIIKTINKKKVKPYRPKQSKFIISLGGKYALADLGFMKFSGFFAWVLKHTVTLRYFLSILPFFDALTLWLRGLKVYIKNN